MSILKLLKSKPMPDKNAPEYRERYEREVAYGRKFADISGISWAARRCPQGRFPCDGIRLCHHVFHNQPLPYSKELSGF